MEIKTNAAAGLLALDRSPDFHEKKSSILENAVRRGARRVTGPIELVEEGIFRFF